MVNSNKNNAPNNSNINKRQRSKSTGDQKSENVESGNPGKFRKSENFKNQPTFNKGDKPPFNKGNKPSFKSGKGKGQASKKKDEGVVEDQPIINNKANKTVVGVADKNSVKKTEVLNKNIDVRKEFDDRTIFVQNIPVTVQEKTLQKFFAKYGNIKNVKLSLLSAKAPAAFSFIEFEKREDAHKSLEVNGLKYKGRNLQVEICKDNSPFFKGDNAVLLKNVTVDVDINDLCQALEAFGAVRYLRIKRLRKYARVWFESADSVKLALDKKNIAVGDKEIAILPGTFNEEVEIKKKNSTKKFKKLQKRAGPKIIVRQNKNKNSFTVTVGHGRTLRKPKFGRKPQGRTPQTGVASKTG